MSAETFLNGRQNISTAVMQRRVEAPHSLDFFPTPPWATRALMHDVLEWGLNDYPKVWEPACGEGHMARVLMEECGFMFASDVHDYGVDSRVGSFVGRGADVVDCPFDPDWVITNPPFNLALEFAERGLRVARRGVALLVRSAWSEGNERFNRLFSVSPPSIIAQFCERVPMVKGRWDPKASTATSYAWFIWLKQDSPHRPTEFRWIPPGARERNSRPDDVKRFAGIEAAE